MARLPQGEKQNRARRISRLLQKCRLGLSEQEIAAETGLDRRPGRSPHGGRGLKHQVSGVVQAVPRRSPHGGRGLKQYGR